jgi:3-keto-L-gulonate-6-phosphate decarboxylase
MNVKDHELKVGGNANLVVLNAPNVLEALREHAAPKSVISDGKVIDRAKMESMWKQ